MGPPPDEMLIDGTIGRPEKASPLSTNASCTALGELSTTHGARPILSSITSPYRSASCAMRMCGGGPSPAALPSPMNGSEPKTGTDGADGGVSRTIGADDDALAVRGKDRLHGKCRKRGVNPVTRATGRYLNEE